MEVTRQKGTESGYDYTIQKDNKVLIAKQDGETIYLVSSSEQQGGI